MYEETNPESCEVRLNDYRKSYELHPNDLTVQSGYANTLVCAMKYSVYIELNYKPEDVIPDDRDGLLDELRNLNRDHSGNSHIYECLAEGLQIQWYRCFDTGLYKKYYQLIQELHRIAEKYSEPNLLQEIYASSLHAAMLYTHHDKRYQTSEEYLHKLRQLKNRFPENLAIAEQFAQSLNGMVYFKLYDRDLGVDSGLLDELYVLGVHSSEDSVLQCYLICLFNILSYMQKKGDSGGRELIRKRLGESVHKLDDIIKCKHILGQLAEFDQKWVQQRQDGL